MNSPCCQHLSHRLVDHFGSAVCFNCHRSQKPNYEHLLQKRICKRAFSAQDHTQVLPADRHPVSQDWSASCGGLPTQTSESSAVTAPRKLPRLRVFCCLHFVCLDYFLSLEKPCFSSIDKVGQRPDKQPPANLGEYTRWQCMHHIFSLKTGLSPLATEILLFGLWIKLSYKRKLI